MTEQLLQQQLESPSGRGVSNPEVTVSLTRPATNERDASRQIPFSLAVVRHAAGGHDDRRRVRQSAFRWAGSEGFPRTKTNTYAIR